MTHRVYADRFIPSREGSELSQGIEILDQKCSGKSFQLSQNYTDAEREENRLAYSAMLSQEILGKKSCITRQILSPTKSNFFQYTSPVAKKQKTHIEMGRSPVFSDEDSIVKPKPTLRKVAKEPYKVLDAPALRDDYYLNLVDWSDQNILAVGLGRSVYLWSATTSGVTKLCDLAATDSATSVCWIKGGSSLAVGTNLGLVKIYDCETNKLVRSLSGHKGRVGALAWQQTRANPVFASGARDSNIFIRDLRSSNAFEKRLGSHQQEVCGLKWSQDGKLASGGNDNKLFVWDCNSNRPVSRFLEHSAAVKAIAWSPHQRGLLASGGGTADRCIRFWSTQTNTMLNCLDTKSQVCNLAWSPNSNEIVSTHGYVLNQIRIWQYPSLTKVATLSAHLLRVLYLAVSPNGENIVTGAGDETLRFWKVFPPKTKRRVTTTTPSISQSRPSLR